MTIKEIPMKPLRLLGLLLMIGLSLTIPAFAEAPNPCYMSEQEWRYLYERARMKLINGHWQLGCDDLRNIERAAARCGIPLEWRKGEYPMEEWPKNSYKCR